MAKAKEQTNESKLSLKILPDAVEPEESNEQLDKFFLDAIKDIYWAEKALTKALPKMEEAATSEALQSAINAHLTQTEEQVTRLEQVFELLGENPQAKKCDAMEGLIKEGETAVQETEDGSKTRDVAIIMAAQKVEHYEIATYAALASIAGTMGKDDIADLLEQTLEEEEQTDALLTEIAEDDINWGAAQGEEEGEDEEVDEDEEDDESDEEPDVKSI